MALLFDLSQLISMLSIGTLLAYSLVALCVMILRFSEGDETPSAPHPSEQGVFGIGRLLVNANKRKRPSTNSIVVANALLALYCTLALALNAYMSRLGESLYDGSGSGNVVMACMGAALIIILVLLSLQPKSDVRKLSFSAPLVPVLPCISIFLNFYLMVELDFHTWLRFLVWLTIGAVLYFSYSIRHSKERDGKPPQVGKALEAQATTPSDATYL